MKKLQVYKENGEFVIERVNEFNHAWKRSFISEEALKEGLRAYKDVLADYQLDVSDELWAFVINYLNSKEFQE